MGITREFFECLSGTWRLEREISGYAITEGISTFSSHGLNCLLYREDILVNEIYSGATHKAYREYYYTYISLEDKITKHFIDDKFFY